MLLFSAGCAAGSTARESGEFYLQVPGAVAWSKRHIHETQHYRVESNCSPDFAERCGRTLEMLYTQWSRHIGEPVLNRKLKVQVYATREGFQQALKKSDLVRGLYGDGVVITYRGIWRGSSTKDSLFHEGTHQLHHAAVGIEKAPIWLAEGLARFFEKFEFDARGSLYPAFDDDGLMRTRREIRKPGGMLLALLSTPKESFDVDCYDRAHLLVYFLVNTTGANRAVFDSYWRELLEKGEKPGSARFIELLGGKKGLTAFEKRWREWISRLHYEDTPQKALEADNARPEQPSDSD